MWRLSTALGYKANVSCACGSGADAFRDPPLSVTFAAPGTLAANCER